MNSIVGVPKNLIITSLSKFEEPWIDPKVDVPNYHKHMLSCHKARKKRKKKKKHK